MTDFCLKPSQIFDLCKESYATKEFSESLFAAWSANNLPMVDPASIAKMHAISGELFKSQSGFGFVAKGSGSRTNEVFVATRGTASVEDAATDFNAIGAPGLSGHIMHRGFYKTFRSYAQDLERSIKKAYPEGRPHAVHCMGHSLGGALANLNAAALAELGYNVYLYTVAAPRVGQMGFAEHMSEKMKHDQIYRVANLADPVTMVPFYPFMHGPLAVGQVNIDPGGFNINPFSHTLAKGYKVLQRADWSSLKAQSAATQTMLQDKANRFNASEGYNDLSNLQVGALHSFKLLWVLAAKLDAVLNKRWAGLMCTRYYPTGAFTALDQWAEMLATNVTLGGIIERETKGILAMISRFMGRVRNFSERLSYGLIRHILELFAQALNGFYKLAIGSLKHG